MAEQSHPEELARLRAEFAAQQAAFVALRERVERRERRRAPRRLLPLLLAGLLVALVPLATLAANPFNDLNPNSVHNANIDAIYNAGITTGCDPNVSYCPNGTVTREEMASFLARTAGLGTNPPVVNAKTAQSAAGLTLTSGGTIYKANDLARAFRASNGTNNAGGEVVVPRNFTDTTVISTTFTAPTAGYVVLNASLYFIAPATGCPCAVGYYLRTGTGALVPANNSPTMGQYVQNGISTSGAATWVFPVTAGANTFSAMAFRTGASTVDVSIRPAVSGIFVPFGATGTAP